jgi:hypothetical protein
MMRWSARLALRTRISILKDKGSEGILTIEAESPVLGINHPLNIKESGAMSTAVYLSAGKGEELLDCL